MKKIHTKADLAINGAPAAFEQALHVGRPNIGSKDEFLQYVDQIYDNNWLTNNGPLVQEFERQIADYHQVKNCVAMSNGTVALEIAIRALELTGEVIIPSYTFIATAHALHWQQITPVFADIDPKTHCLDPEAVKKMITPKTSGIIGVHLWGNAAPVDELQQIADEFGLTLMFDAAHAFGCSYRGEMIGRFGEAEVFSFHATKFLNSFEGGAVLTNNDELAEKMRLMRNFGFAGMDNVIHPGTNGKMSEICAAMGLVNFNNLSNLILNNEQNYCRYKEELSTIPGINIYDFPEKEQKNFQYVVIELTDDYPLERDEVIDLLHKENIKARRYFWPGCHQMSPYKELYPHARLMLRNTDRVANKTIVMPTGASVTGDAIKTIGDILKIVLEK